MSLPAQGIGLARHREGVRIQLDDGVDARAALVERKYPLDVGCGELLRGEPPRSHLGLKLGDRRLPEAEVGVIGG